MLYLLICDDPDQTKMNLDEHHIYVSFFVFIEVRVLNSLNLGV